MIEPINIPHHTSPQRAIRLALGKTGYNDLMQTMQTDLIAWAIEGSDLISRPKTFVVDGCDLTVCDNKIQFPEQALMVNCISYKGIPMSFSGNRGCGRINPNSPCCTCGNTYTFTLDSCYAHFKPSLEDGTELAAEWLCRPYDDEGYPQVLDVCTLAISEYVASMVCVRYKDSNFSIWNDKWLHHVRLARSEVNKILGANIADLSAVYFRKPGGGYGRRGGY